MEIIKANIREVPKMTASFGDVVVQSGEGGTTRHSRLTERE